MKLFEINYKSDHLEGLQNKISLIFAFLVGILMFFLGISGFYFNLPPLIVLAKFVISILFLAGFWIMKRYGGHQIVINLMLLICFSAISLNYFNNEVFRGPTIYTIYVFIVFITVLVNGWKKYVWLILTILFFGSLFYAEIDELFGGQHDYRTFNDLFWDHWAAILGSGLFVFIGIHTLIKNYRTQNQLLSKIQEEKELALKELRELNLKKNQLIALLSHDLRNPIGMLSMTLELVDEGAFEGGELEELLNNLKNQSFHLNKVLNNTLGWVMSELEESNFDLKHTSLIELTKEIQEVMMVPAAQKGQEIIVSTVGEDLMIDLEVNEVNIILKNLLDNAIKFSPVGAKIDLDLIVSATQIRWEVKNEGETIPKAIQDNLFEFKVRTSYGTMKEKGAGIGLPLCKKIADKLKLKLGLENGPNDNNVVFYLIRNLG